MNAIAINRRRPRKTVTSFACHVINIARGVENETIIQLISRRLTYVMSVDGA